MLHGVASKIIFAQRMIVMCQEPLPHGFHEVYAKLTLPDEMPKIPFEYNYI